jgi:hypothetical protein
MVANLCALHDVIMKYDGNCIMESFHNNVTSMIQEDEPYFPYFSPMNTEYVFLGKCVDCAIPTLWGEAFEAMCHASLNCMHQGF